jgi:hypothetical protein
MQKQLTSSYWHELAEQTRLKAESIRQATVRFARRIEAVDPFREGSVVNGKVRHNAE